MVKWYGAAGLVMWLGGTVAAYLATFGGVATEQVTLRLGDDMPIRGTLYHTELPPEKMPGVVILHGTALAHRSCAPALAAPLARKGFIVLAIDVMGHGDSGGSQSHSDFGELETVMRTSGKHPEVEAAIDFLKAHPHVDPSRLALVGHSWGGWAAVNTARRRPDIRSVVALGAAPVTCDPLHPSNLLLITGGNDCLTSVSGSVRAIARATDGAVQQPRTIVGKFQTGTARQWILLPGAYHLSQLVDPAVSRYVLQWVGGSFHLDTGALPGRRLLTTTFGAIVASLGGAAAASWVLMFLHGLGKEVPVPAPRAGALRRLSLIYGLLLMAAPATAFLATRLEGGPVQFAVPTLVLCACVACICFGGGAVRRRQHDSGRQAVSILQGSRRTTLQNLALGGLCLGLGFVWLGVPWGVAWADLVPTSRRFLLGLTLLFLLLPWCLLLALGVERAVAGWGGAFGRALVWLGLPIIVWVGHQWFAAGSWPFSVSIWLLGGSFLIPLPLWLLSNRPGLFLARAVSHAGGAAWLWACHLPFVHHG